MRSNAGHRQRVKERFVKEGLENFEESHALELLLFYAVPRRDTKPIARRLLDRFGSFADVLEADMESLQKVEGVGPSVAAYIRTIHEVGRYYQLNRNQKRAELKDLNQCGEYMLRYFHGATKETVYMLCLDAKRCVICCRELTTGDVTSASISTRDVVEQAMSAGAVSVVLAHNHPRGNTEASDEDLLVTKRICATLASVGIILADHIIVSGDSFTSMTQSGIYTPRDYRLMLV